MCDSVTGPERDGLIQLTRDARQPGWWHSFRDVLPNPYEVYIGLEAGAASLRNFEPIAGASPPVPSCNRQSCCAATSAGSLSDDPGSTWRPRLYTGTARVD